MKKLLTILITLILSICLINVNTNKTSAEDGEIRLKDGYLPIVYMRINHSTGHLRFEIVPSTIGTTMEEVSTPGGEQASISSSITGLNVKLGCSAAGNGYRQLIFQPTGRSDIRTYVDVYVETSAKMHSFGNYVNGSSEPYYLAYNGRYDNYINGGSLKSANCYLTVTDTNTNKQINLTFGQDYTVVPVDDGGNCVVFEVKSEFMNSLAGGTYKFLVSAEDTPGQQPIECTEATTVIVNTPSPEPDPKDESCEKVIGPSWHWNESKGICEDYGVVGTYTR